MPPVPRPVRRPLAALVVLLAAALLAAGCGGDEEATSSVAQPIVQDGRQVAAAEREGQLTWYSAYPPEAIQATVDAFEARYPEIEVRSLRLPSGQVGTRYSEERSAGGRTADVVSLSDSTFYDEADDDWFEKEPELPALRAWPKQYYDEGRATTGLLPMGIGRNTQKVADEGATRTWQSMIDPRFRGQILYGDPRTVPAYLALAELWRQEYGEGFLRRLAGQDLQLVESVVPGNQQLAAGGASLIVPGSTTTMNPLIDEGAPIALANQTPTTGVEYGTAISTETPNPAAARVFMNFLLTKPGQAVVNGGGGSSALGQVAEGVAPLPENYRPVDDLLPQARRREDDILRALGVEG